MKNYIVILFMIFLTLPVLGQDDYKYRVKIDAGPILEMKNGSEVPGSARIRIELEGTDGIAKTGKQVDGHFGTISFRDEPIGKLDIIHISIDGAHWSKRIDINKVSISVTDDEDESKKYSFPGGCTLTKGNSKVSLDKAGPLDFAEDEELIAIEKEAENEIELEGDFTYREAKGDGFTISRKQKSNYNKKLKEVITEQNDKRICKTETVEASASFDVNFLTNPSITSVYPGALIYAESMADGSYTNISAKRKPITLSTNIAIIGSPLIEVENPKLSTIRAAMNDILIGQQRGDIQIQANFEIKEVYSKEQLSIALGGHFAYGGGEVNFDFNYDTESESTMKVIKFAQKYYTIDMDQPDSPFDVFQNEEDALEVLESGKTPLYVSQVTYGRMAYFFLKTSMSSSEIKAHLDAAYNGGVTEASGYGDLEIAKLLEQSEMSALIIGGDSSQPLSAVDGVEGFKDMLRDGGTLSPTSLGVPISYTARYLSDSHIARSNLLSTYTKRECREVVGTHESIVISLDDIEMTSAWEDHSELGYYFAAYLLDEDKTAIKTLLGKQATHISALSFQGEGKKTIGATEKFDYKIEDLDNLWVRVTATATEYDDGVFDHHDNMSNTRDYLLADLISSGANPLANTIEASKEEDVVVFHFSLKSSGGR